MHNLPITQPPSIVEIGYRSMILWIMLLRWHLEIQGKTCKTKIYRNQVKAQVIALQELTQQKGLCIHMTRKERKLYQKPFCQWSNQDLTDGFTWSEMLGTLLWGAAILNEYPDSGTRYPIDCWEETIPTLSNPTDFMELVGLRARCELKEAIDTTWLYLARTAFFIGHQGGTIAPEDYPDFVSQMIDGFLDKRVDMCLNQGDLDLRGKPYESISQKDAEDIRRCLEARLMCLGWLMGYRQDWDEPLLNGNGRPAWLLDFED